MEFTDATIVEVILREYGNDSEEDLKKWEPGQAVTVPGSGGEKVVIGYIDQIYPTQSDVG